MNEPTLRAPGIVNTDDEGAFVAALLAGKPSAWRSFHRRYDPLAFHCIAHVVQRFAAACPEDVREIHAQWRLSLLVRGKAKLRAFDPARARLSSYLGMLAAHCAYDWLRARRGEPPREPLDRAARLTSDSPDPFDVAARREQAALAARALEGLSERDRRCAALYFGGASPREIARSLRVSVKTVYSKKHKIKARLESMVAGDPCDVTPRAFS